MEQNVLTANQQKARIDEMRASMTPHERDTFNEALIAEARALLEKGDRMMEAEGAALRANTQILKVLSSPGIK